MKQWDIYKLGDPKICILNPMKREVADAPDERLVSFVPMSKVDDLSGVMDASDERPIGEVKKGYTYFAEGDVVFAKITPCMENGKSAIARDLKNGIGFGTTEFHVLRPGPLVIAKWIHLFIRNSAFRDEAKKNMHGAAGQQRVPIDFLRETKIPIPPLDEQSRIVKRVEELIHRAEEVRRLRMEAMEKVKGLFQTDLERIFHPSETDTWIEFNARDLFDIVKGQVDPKEEPYASLPHIAPDAMEIGTGRLIKDKIKTAADLNLKSGNYLFNGSHVLYSKIRPNLRKVACPDFEGTCSADMYPLIPFPEIIMREFLALILLSPPFTTYAVENSDRNAMPKINRPTMFGYKVKLPGLSEQKKIVSRIRALQDKAENISNLQRCMDQELQKFQSALLTKAFRGEL
jgi:type I restriction enzyme, S subunit